jgi:hypothetical protein
MLKGQDGVVVVAAVVGKGFFFMAIMPIAV